MADFEGPGVSPVYNAGVIRPPEITTNHGREWGVIEQLFGDLLPNKDIVGGQVLTGFIGLLGTPLKATGTLGVYAVADMATDSALVVGLLLLSVDAFDGPRVINVVKGGTVSTEVGYFRGKNDAAKVVVATALGGKYDATFQTIKF